MSELQRKDITIRAVSVLFAIILWFVVFDSVNPIMTMTIDNIPLKVNDSSLLSRNLDIKDRNIRKEISIIIQGRKEKLKEISAEDFEAVLDFSSVMGPGKKDLEISVSPVDKVKNRWVKIVEVKPGIISVNFDRVVEKTFPIEVDTGKVKLKEGYKIIEKSTLPGSITIRDFESLVNAVSSIKVLPDAVGLDRDLSVTKRCVVYKLVNEKEEEMLELSNKQSVTVSVKVAKEVEVVPDIAGVPSEDYYIIKGGIILEPFKVDLRGSPEVLSKINKNDIKTEPIDISNIKEDKKLKVEILLPKGVELVNDTREFYVTIDVEPLPKKELALPGDMIEMKGVEADSTSTYEITTQNITITLQGHPEDLEHVRVDMLDPAIEVTGLAEGLHQVQLKLNSPSNVKLLGVYSAEVKVTKKPVETPPAGMETSQ